MQVSEVTEAVEAVEVGEAPPAGPVQGPVDVTLPILGAAGLVAGFLLRRAFGRRREAEKTEKYNRLVDEALGLAKVAADLLEVKKSEAPAENAPEKETPSLPPKSERERVADEIIKKMNERLAVVEPPSHWTTSWTVVTGDGTVVGTSDARPEPEGFDKLPAAWRLSRETRTELVRRAESVRAAVVTGTSPQAALRSLKELTDQCLSRFEPFPAPAATGDKRWKVGDKAYAVVPSQHEHGKVCARAVVVFDVSACGRFLEVTTTDRTEATRRYVGNSYHVFDDCDRAQQLAAELNRAAAQPSELKVAASSAEPEPKPGAPAAKFSAGDVIYVPYRPGVGDLWAVDRATVVDAARDGSVMARRETDNGRNVMLYSHPRKTLAEAEAKAFELNCKQIERSPIVSGEPAFVAWATDPVEEVVVVDAFPRDQLAAHEIRIATDDGPRVTHREYVFRDRWSAEYRQVLDKQKRASRSTT